MDFAVIKSGGKQYTVHVGDAVTLERIDGKEGDIIQFDTLLISGKNGESLKVGTPILTEKVSGKVLGFSRGKKILVVKFKSKVRYKRTQGHRQNYMKVQITKI